MAGAVHPRPMSPCTAPILVLTRSFVRSTGLPMPKVNGIGRSKKRKKLAPVAPTEPMPDKEGELIEDAKEEAEEPEIDSELIEEAACKVEEMILEELMDVSKVVRELMFDLYKCEVAAASIREAMEAKFGVGECSCFGESAPWFEAYDDALGELRDKYDECGIFVCPTCGSGPVFCNYCRVDCACGTRHLRYAWVQGYRCGLRRSPGSPFIGE